MREEAWNAIMKGGTAVAQLMVGLATLLLRAITSEPVKNALSTGVNELISLGASAGRGTLRLGARAFPRLKKVLVVVILGGARYFIGSFNRNGGSMVQNVRKPLRPVGVLLLFASVGLVVIQPYTGIGAFAVTFIVFFQDVDGLPLSTFATDTLVSGTLGIGAAVILNVFRAVGAARSTVRWVSSQL